MFAKKLFDAEKNRKAPMIIITKKTILEDKNIF